MAWFVYMALCADKSIYTGITTNVQRRFREHMTGKGAKYTRAKQIRKILYTEKQRNRSFALKREMEIKGWSREKKLKLANDW
ncbi:MAG: GIY-YIG nuclease family protein [Patescibacteria group bacterium]